MDTAPRTARQNTGQRASGFFCKAVRKSGDNNEVIRFSDFAGSRVVLFNRFEFTAKIRLEDALHMFGDFLQSITDLSRVCPDSITDQQLIEVRQMHQSGKALAKPHRVN